MLTESRIGTVVLRSKNVERARSFYEDALGFVPLRAFPNSVTYDAGGVKLTINESSDFGKERNPEGDDTELLVFHVDSVDEMRTALEERGVEFGQTLRYEIGATVDCHDPDLHNITLYEPSAESLTWPSGKKVMEIVNSGKSPGGTLLGTRKLLYLFLFVRDTLEAAKFYRDSMGLRVIEEDPEAGVVKYDCGGLIIATHLVGGDAKCAVDMDLTYEKGVVASFSVNSLSASMQSLEARRVPFVLRRS